MGLNVVMASEIKYDFNTSEEKKPSEVDARTNLRITRCCGNCKFFVAKTNRGFRGFCRYPLPSSKNLAKVRGESRDWKEMEKTWAKAHFTMLCDLYQYRSTNTASIGKWIGKEFLTDGTIKDE